MFIAVSIIFVQIVAISKVIDYQNGTEKEFDILEIIRIFGATLFAFLILTYFSYKVADKHFEDAV